MTDASTTVTTVTANDVTPYLVAASVPFEPDQLADALAAEAADQRSRCRFPLDDTGAAYYTPALIEALKRRCAHNLAVRRLPLGIQASITETTAMTTYVGGLDAEVKRLEAPYRKRPIG